ncbi:hypothetical protein N7513_007628 [Penicillium frequentans]|nr:hypothetical protein N7513_007628 [Penicillium glabrum]
MDSEVVRSRTMGSDEDSHPEGAESKERGSYGKRGQGGRHGQAWLHRYCINGHCAWGKSDKKL